MLCAHVGVRLLSQRPETRAGELSPSRHLGRYLHGGVVVCVQGALGHGGEGLADEQLGEGWLRAPHHCRQDVDGGLRTGGGGQDGLGWGGVPTPWSPPWGHTQQPRERSLTEGDFLKEKEEREGGLCSPPPRLTGGGWAAHVRGLDSQATRSVAWSTGGALPNSLRRLGDEPTFLKPQEPPTALWGGPEPRALAASAGAQQSGVLVPPTALTAHSPAGSLSAGACMMLTRVGISLICIGPWQASIWDSSLKMS